MAGKKRRGREKWRGEKTNEAEIMFPFSFFGEGYSSSSGVSKSFSLLVRPFLAKKNQISQGSAIEWERKGRALGTV